MNRPRLVDLKVWLLDGALGVEGEVADFQEEVTLDPRFKPFVLLKKGQTGPW